MASTLDRQESGGGPDLKIVREDSGLSNDFEGIAREVTRAKERTSKPPLEATPANLRLTDSSLAVTGGAVVSETQDKPRNWLVRGLAATTLFACIALTAIFWQSSYFDQIRPFGARWLSQPALSTERARSTGESSPSVMRAAIVNPATTQSTPASSPALDNVASAETARLESALANVAQAIGELRDKQEEFTRDSARSAEQIRDLKAQLDRQIARADEQGKAAQEELARISAMSLERSARLKPVTRRSHRRRKL